MKLHKHVVTADKVSFIEAQSHDDLQSGRHPVILTISKQEWLDRGRPEAVGVNYT